jgi:hypothetical protein
MNSREARARRSFELYFDTKTSPIDQLIFITKVFNEIQTGRALLTSPRGIGFSRSQPAVYLELLQLYYDPFITSSMNDAQNCLSPSYRHPAVVEFIETTLVRFRTSATNRLKQEPIPLLQELFANSYLFDTIRIRNPADPRM